MGGDPHDQGRPGDGQALPVIGLTAHAMTGDRERAIEAGCTDYHTKPVEFPRLLSQIEAILGKRPSAALQRSRW